MGKGKIKHLGRNRRKNKKMKIILNKVFIALSLIIVIGTLIHMTKEIERATNKEEINLTRNQIEFINSIHKEAKNNYKEYKILPSITVAQAILESGWGGSKLTKTSNNLFGIKADISWQGDSIEVMTGENYNDKVKAKFRKYDSLSDSIKDHGKFLYENERYKNNGVFDTRNYKKQAQALEDAGYATKKDKDGNLIYADMLIDIIKKYNLDRLDFE